MESHTTARRSILDNRPSRRPFPCSEPNYLRASSRHRHSINFFPDYPYAAATTGWRNFRHEHLSEFVQDTLQRLLVEIGSRSQRLN